jgi:Tfp pilus assembly protein PilV
MKNKSGFTLIEIIFSVAFLSIVCLVMISLLFKSYDLEKEIDVQDVASIKASNFIEEIKSGKTEIKEEQMVYYDEWFSETNKSEAVYTLTARMKKNGSFGLLYDIFVNIVDEEGDLILRLETKHYYGKE